jgi:hypothetical protein
MRRFLFIPICLTILCCGRSSSNSRQHDAFEAAISPAFSERALVNFFVKDDTPTLKILIRNDIRADEKEDTFYYRSVALDKSKLNYFDSLLDNWPQPWKPHAVTVVDGIHFTLIKSSLHDTSMLQLHGPSFRNDSTGYRMTSSLLNAFAACFEDSLINDYFQEVRLYLQDDTISSANRPILFERRAVKYGWRYRR